MVLLIVEKEDVTMKKLLLSVLLASAPFAFAAKPLPTKNQERIYKQEIAFINTLPKDASDEQLKQMYLAHLGTKWFETDEQGNIKKDVDGKPIHRKVDVNSIDDDHVYYSHLTKLLEVKKNFATFKAWLEGQVSGINFVRVLEPESGK